MSADRLAEIKARADAATEGPWSAKGGFTSDPMIEVYGQTVFINPDLDGDPIQPEVWADAEFIAAASVDVPWLVDQVESLERWKFEALEVMSGLRELGKALGLGLGVQITGPAALAEVARLTAERDAFRKREECLSNEVEWWKERFPCDGMCSDAPEEDCSRHGRSPADLWRIISEIAAERDALVTTVGRVQALVDSNPDHADTCGSVLTPGAGYPCSCWQADLRAALATTGEDQ